MLLTMVTQLTYKWTCPKKLSLDGGIPEIVTTHSLQRYSFSEVSLYSQTVNYLESGSVPTSQNTELLLDKSKSWAIQLLFMTLPCSHVIWRLSSSHPFPYNKSINPKWICSIIESWPTNWLEEASTSFDLFVIVRANNI